VHREVLVQPPGGLVGDQERRMDDEGAGDRRPLLLAEGDLVRRAVGQVAGAADYPASGSVAGLGTGSSWGRRPSPATGLFRVTGSKPGPAAVAGR
jgi:hypothetical protein